MHIKPGFKVFSCSACYNVKRGVDIKITLNKDILIIRIA